MALTRSDAASMSESFARLRDGLPAAIKRSSLDKTLRRCAMLLVLVIAVPIVLLFTWAVLFDVRQRHRKAPLTYRAVRGIAGKTRAEAQRKGSEWGSGV